MIIHSAVTLQGLLGFCVVLGCCCCCVGGTVRGWASPPNLGSPAVPVQLSQEGCLISSCYIRIFFCKVFTRVHRPLCHWIKQMLHLSLLSGFFLFISYLVILPPLCGRRVRTVKTPIQKSGYFCIFQHLVIITLFAWRCAISLHMCHQVCLWFVGALILLLGLVRDTCAAPVWHVPYHDAGMLIPRGSIRTRLICGDVQNEKMLSKPKDFDICHILLLLQSLNSVLAV